MNISQKIEELKARLEQLEKEYKETEKSEWPSIGDTCWLIYADGSVGFIIHSEHDKTMKAIGNFFRTKQEAEAEVEARKVIAELRATEGRVDPFTHDSFGIEVNYDSVQEMSGKSEVGLYWESEDYVEQAIAKVGESRILAAVRHFARV